MSGLAIRTGPFFKEAMMAKDEMNFLEFLQSFRRGELLDDADQSLTELIEAVERTGGGGSRKTRPGNWNARPRSR